MQISFKYHNCPGFGRLYNYAIKQNYMITKEAETRIKILKFWHEYGLEATKSAFGAKQSTLYLWQKILREGDGKIECLNPGSQARRNKNK